MKNTATLIGYYGGDNSVQFNVNVFVESACNVAYVKYSTIGGRHRVFLLTLKIKSFIKH